MSWFLAAGVVAVLALGASGCGGGGGETTASSPRKVREIALNVDGRDGPQDAGILMAEKRGYFKDVGLEVSIYNPVSPNRPIGYVTEEVVDLAVSHQPQVALAQENGAPLVAVGSLISQPTAAMIWLKKSKIQSVTDLGGKTIGIPGLPFQKAFLESVLESMGMTLADVKLKTVGYEAVPALAKGEVDAIFGGSSNVEGVELEAQGLEPVVTPVQNLGIPPYEELVLIALRDRLKQDPQTIRDFISAMDRGAAAAIEDPQAAASALEAEDTVANKAVVKAQLEATLPLLSTTSRMNPEQASGLVGWMHEEGMIQRPLPVSELLTNDYLPSS